LLAVIVDVVAFFYVVVAIGLVVYDVILIVGIVAVLMVVVGGDVVLEDILLVAAYVFIFSVAMVVTVCVRFVDVVHFFVAVECVWSVDVVNGIVMCV